MVTWRGWAYSKKKYEVLAHFTPAFRDEVCGECMPERKTSLPDRLYQREWKKGVGKILLR